MSHRSRYNHIACSNEGIIFKEIDRCHIFYLIAIRSFGSGRCKPCGYILAGIRGREECFKPAIALVVTAVIITAFTGSLGCLGNFLIALFGKGLTHCQHLSVLYLDGHRLRYTIDFNFGLTVFIVSFGKSVFTFGQNNTLLAATVGISLALGGNKTAVIKKENGFNPVFFSIGQRIPSGNCSLRVSDREESPIVL